MENNILQHHGVIGMKWGVRRYQNKDGSLTKAGKKRYDDNPDNDEQETYEERKQRALKTGSASDVLKFKGDLTQKEMQDAISRIRWEQDMKNLSEKEVAVGKSRVEGITKGLGKVTDLAVSAAKAYNTAANIYNAFAGVDKKLLPTIKTGNTDDNRSQRKAEAKERKKEEDAKKKREEQEAQRETKQAERAEKKAKNKKSDNTQTVHDSDYVIIDDAPKSSKNSKKSKKTEPETIIIDDDFGGVTVSNVPATVVNTGRQMTELLLKRYW